MKPELYTISSPELIKLYNLENSLVLIIDVFRATSSIATALYNGCKYVVPVIDIEKCKHLGLKLKAITAGERNGQIIEGLHKGNSPSDFPSNYIKNRILIITTTNGTKLIHLAKKNKAAKIILGSFVNIDAVVEYINKQKMTTYLCCAGWKGRFNIEDFLFAGAVINEVASNFTINCDSSLTAKILYQQSQSNLFDFIKLSSHWQRLVGFGTSEEDLRFCLTKNASPCLPLVEKNNKIRNALPS